MPLLVHELRPKPMNMQQSQGQPPGPQQQQHNASSSSNPPPVPRPWHTEGGDFADRRVIVDHIMQLLQRKKSAQTTPDWQQRMPDFVRRLEEDLYRDAATKEEYKDLSTLERRLQSVAHKLARHSAGRVAPVRNVEAHRPASSMIPTPGTTAMIPTPGLAAPVDIVTPRPSGLPSVRMPSVHSNGHSFTNGSSPFIGNGQSFDGNGNNMYSQGFLGQNQVSREMFRAGMLNGDPSMPSSKMIPVPGLPSQVVQQLRTKNVQDTRQQASASQKRPVLDQPAQPGDNRNISPRPTSQPSTPDADQQRRLVQKQRFLLIAHHAKCCSGQCTVSHCKKLKELLAHCSKCKEQSACSFGTCHQTKMLIKHFSNCQSQQCKLCAPVRQQLLKMRGQSSSAANSGAAAASTCTDETQPPAAKKLKLDPDVASEAGVGQLRKVKAEPTSSSPQKVSALSKGKALAEASDSKQLMPVKIEKQDVPDGLPEGHSSTLEQDLGCGLVASKLEDSSASNSKSSKAKVIGISLLELFSTEQIQKHISSLRLWIGQSKAKAERNQCLEQQMSENACRLCAVERLTFEPPPLYCSYCGARIKRNVTYYTAMFGETRHYFCIPCYNAVPGDTFELEGQSHSKARLEKWKNIEEIEEAWVQCDKCNLWQHQICALFNGRRNEGGDAEYVCPFCLIQEMETSERMPLPSTSILGAKDLPRTLLSDHLEQRLCRRLKQERMERASSQGKSFEEVPGAEGLVVRVVSSVDKKLEVKPRFYEIFKDSNYPSEFMYKSKALLLFQRIEGVEVCLFGLYVQEFGADCPQPNNRRLYVAYLDSVKYFRPEVKTVHGEALRTFVYHELLIGYLEYSKRRGFGSCYIWACPPLRGEDYILYCHPEIQKTPKSDKLRDWYLSMLSKATKENIVVELTNFYDYFFVSPEECKANVTAARLPYFDGDYWPGAAEDMLFQFHQEEEDKRKRRGGYAKKGLGKRAEISTNAARDAQLMQKLGQTIYPMREDFIMVHMHHSCRHCRLFITTGLRWVCKQCKNFQLCNRCYLADQQLEERDRHPSSSKDSHQLYSVEVGDVPADTKDNDENIESEFFDTRQAFLSLCQGNHYQHETLRRAKHSSMMVLYHLHNPTAPAFVTTCNMCNHEIETGQGWRCETCPDFDVCMTCYPKELPKHPHTLTRQLPSADRNGENTEARKQRVLQLRKMMELLIHSSQCCSVQCQYPKCRNVKNLFRHGTSCRTRASGGCKMCKMMWQLLQFHARACKEADCRVPRCTDLKEHLRRLQQQAESRRRAAVMEMIRQRTSDIASSTTS